MLTMETRIPRGAGNGSPVLVLLHGRGADERDLLGLAGGLPAGVALVTPRGPFSGAELGYGGGWAWYRFLGENRPEPEHFSASLAALDELVSGLPGALGFEPGAVVVGGFSQGGTSALGYALSHRDRVAGVLMFSGFLADHPAVDDNLAAAAGLPVFWGHGTQDPMMPYAGSAVPGRAALIDAGADLVARDYPIGHWIDPRELADAGEWLVKVTGAVAGGAR
jgi:phospholipase/carboxylesterase